MPSFTPGTNRAYQASTFPLIAGGIILKASGRYLSDVIREEIAEPLGLAVEMILDVPDNIGARLAILDVWDPSKWGLPADSKLFKPLPSDREGWEQINTIRTRSGCIPSTTGLYTAHALANMYRAFANGGVVEGVKLVSADTIKQMQKLVTDMRDKDRLKGEGRPVPHYGVVEEEGPSPRRRFRIECRLDDGTVTSGEGHSKKAAQQEAAREALLRLREPRP